MAVLRGSQHRPLFPPELKCIIYVVYVIKYKTKQKTITSSDEGMPIVRLQCVFFRGMNMASFFLCHYYKYFKCNKNIVYHRGKLAVVLMDKNK